MTQMRNAMNVETTVNPIAERDLESELLEFIYLEIDANSLLPNGVWFHPCYKRMQEPKSVLKADRYVFPREDKTGDFQIIPGYLFSIDYLNSDDRILLAFIINTTIHGNGCMMSNAGLADRFGMSYDMVKRSIRKMRTKGMISDKGRTINRVLKVNIGNTLIHPESTKGNSAPNTSNLVQICTEFQGNFAPHNKKELLVINGTQNQGYVTDTALKAGEGTKTNEDKERFDLLWKNYNAGGHDKGYYDPTKAAWDKLEPNEKDLVEKAILECNTLHKFRISLIAFMDKSKSGLKPEKKKLSKAKQANKTQAQDTVRANSITVMNEDRLPKLRQDNEALHKDVFMAISGWKMQAKSVGKHIKMTNMGKFVDMSKLYDIILEVPDDQLLQVISEEYRKL